MLLASGGLVEARDAPEYLTVYKMAPPTPRKTKDVKY